MSRPYLDIFVDRYKHTYQLNSGDRAKGCGKEDLGVFLGVGELKIKRLEATSHILGIIKLAKLNWSRAPKPLSEWRCSLW